jgi:DNA-binding transcriptional regulator YdaS (Cro superfamily)
MLTKTAIAHFGTQTALARALSITRSAVSQWGREVPALRQFQIERVTSGKLRARSFPTRERR